MPNPQSTINNQQSAKRPFAVTLLVVLVLILTSLNLLRLIETIRLWDLLAELPSTVPPLYLAVSGALWGIVGLPLAWGLFFGKRWAVSPTRIAALAYSFYYWLDRLLIAQPATIANRWLFAAFLTLLLLVFTFWALNRKNAFIFFHKIQTDSF